VDKRSASTNSGMVDALRLSTLQSYNSVPSVISVANIPWS